MARALFGEIPIHGHLPVTIPGVRMKAGFGLEIPAEPMKLQPMDVRGEAQLQPAFDVLEAAIKDQAFPGATLAVGYRGKVSLHAFGKLTYDVKSPAVSIDTMYDIASLTKVVATTTIVAKLAEGDFPVRSGSGCKGRTLSAGMGQRSAARVAAPRHGSPSADAHFRPAAVQGVLAHIEIQAGHARQDFRRTARVRTRRQRGLFRPGNYSDGGNHRDDLPVSRSMCWRANLYFHRWRWPTPCTRRAKKMWPTIAPTEIDNQYRHRLVQGEVHDENAAAIGGVSGHAGVFSTAPDLAVFCQMLLNGGVYAHQRILRRATISEFTEPQELSAEGTNAWLGGSHRRRLQRPLLRAALVRTHRFYGNLDLDRPRPPAFRRASHQPRVPDPRKPEAHQGASRCA